MNRNLIAAKVRYGIATKDEMASLSRADLLAMKTSEEGAHFRFSDGLVVEEKASGKLGERQHEHVMSTERKDTMGDIIRVKGWNLERVKSAMPVFWAHESRDLPIGVMKRAWKGQLPEGTPAHPDRANNKALLGKYEIHHKDSFGEDNVFGQKAEAVESLLAAGAIRSGSVGFMPDETYFPKSAEEADEMGLGPWGVEFLKQTQLEWTITPIPANADANEIRSAAQESRAAGTAVLKSMVKAGQLLPDAAEALLDEIFSERAYDFLKGEDKTVVAMGDIDINALLGEPVDEAEAKGVEAEDAVELEERDAEPEPEAARNTPEPDLGQFAKTLEQVTETVARLTEANTATATAMKHILERFEEYERTTSKGIEGGQSAAELAEVESPGRSGLSRSEDPSEFAETLMRGVLEGLKSDGAQTQTDDHRDPGQGPSS